MKLHEVFGLSPVLVQIIEPLAWRVQPEPGDTAVMIRRDGDSSGSVTERLYDGNGLLLRTVIV